MSDSRELTKHLRTVHLTLIATCAVLIAAITLDTRTLARNAYNDITLIRKLQMNWDSNWLEVHAKETVATEISPHFYTFADKATSPFSTKTFTLKIDKPWTTYPPPKEQTTEDTELPMYYQHSKIELAMGLHKPVTLQDFIARWNQYSEHHYVYFAQNLPDTAHVDEPLITSGGSGSDNDPSITVLQPHFVGTRTLKEIPEPDPGSAIVLLRPFMWLKKKGSNNKEDLILSLESFPSYGTDVYPVKVWADRITRKELNFQSYLIHKINAPWRIGKFEDSFRELDEWTRHIRSTELEQLERHLYEVYKREGETFEIFGAKFRAESLHQWGAFILLGIQVYLWLHLRTLRDRTEPEDPAWDYPWICFYEGFWPRFAFHVSALIFPVVTVYILTKDQVQSLSWESFVAVASFLLSAILALASREAEETLRQKKPAQPV